MPFSREQIRNIPFLGYLLSVGYSIMKLPPMWADLHRDVSHLHRSVLELKDSHGAIGKFNGLVTSGLVAEHSARLIDHAAQFEEQTHELAELNRRIDALDANLNSRLAVFGQRLDALEETASRQWTELSEFRGQLAEQQE